MEVKDGFLNFASEIRANAIEQRENKEKEIFDSGYRMCLYKTLNLLVDSKMTDAEITSLLQKHFDLRLSEVNDLIRKARNRKKRNK